MALKDLLKKKDTIRQHGANEPDNQPPPHPPHPEFTFVRSTTDLEEVISPPSFPADEATATTTTPHLTVDKTKRTSASPSRPLFHLRKPSRNSTPPPDEPTSTPDATPDSSSASLSAHGAKSDERRLSRRLEEKLHLHSRSRSRTASVNSSARVPVDLPEIDKTGAQDPEAEAAWEKRALLLANQNEVSTAGAPPSHGPDDTAAPPALDGYADGTGATAAAQRPPHTRTISNVEGDVTIQEAIRLHEESSADSLPRSTRMFRTLADPHGQNNALAQVLYGLALRHGWGCQPDQAAALTYLSLAASNSALVESAALSTGALKGGAAKGELVLAIFELGNSFRHGWGCDKDPVAARKYYETAANLGDTDAMAEVAWCYLQGFGGKKDKFKAAQYLKMAEKKGVTEPGNSWIWKDKYSEPVKS